MRTNDRLVRGIRTIRLDDALNALTATAMQRAAAAASKVEDPDAVDGPTSIRMNRLTLTFYDTLASELGVSRNAILKMLLEHLVQSTASPEEKPQAQ